VLQRVVLEHIWYIVGTLVALAAVLRFVRLQQTKAQREADIETLVESTKTLIKEEKKAGKPPSSVLHIRYGHSSLLQPSPTLMVVCVSCVSLYDTTQGGPEREANGAQEAVPDGQGLAGHLGGGRE
jgi:hypothetical protein